jgi:hypothetical protein
MSSIVVLDIDPVVFNCHELREDLRLAEERVERLRQELHDLQKKRHDSFLRTPPAYITPSSIHSNMDEGLHQHLLTSINRSTSPIVQDVIHSHMPVIRVCVCVCVCVTS